MTGIDDSPEMIAALPAAVEGIVADARTARLGRTFDAVLLASHFVNDPDGAPAFLATAVAHLAPRGLLIAEAYPPSWDPTASVGRESHLGDARVTHRWGGPLGVARDWHASVSYNPRTGVGFAGGYVGDGLSTTNLAGRTLADLVLERRTELTELPWVDHRSPLWEPEPIRWVLANLGITGTGIADVEERLTGRPSLVARMIRPFTGH